MERISLITLLLCCSGCIVICHPTGRVIGGEIADIKEFPYLLQMHIRVQKINEGRCGASAIAANWALTAAHCLDEAEGYIYERYLVANSGVWNAWESDPEIPFECSTDCFLHPKYNISQYNDVDIALILVRNYNFNEKYLVSLPTAAPPVNTLLQAAGWGIGPQDGEPDLLHKIQVPVVEMEECENKFGPLTVHMICAGIELPGHNTCSGDSGSPAVVKNKDTFVQYGLVSMGPQCASPHSFVIYTNVSNERDWIEKTLSLYP